MADYILSANGRLRVDVGATIQYNNATYLCCRETDGGDSCRTCDLRGTRACAHVECVSGVDVFFKKIKK